MSVISYVLGLALLGSGVLHVRQAKARRTAQAQLMALQDALCPTTDVVAFLETHGLAVQCTVIRHFYPNRIVIWRVAGEQGYTLQEAVARAMAVHHARKNPYLLGAP